jgi:hypothetical protein
MWWFISVAGLLTGLGWLLAPSWRTLVRRCPPEVRDSAAVFWAQHSSSHG